MSRLPFELLLAWRYLRPKRTFVSVVTFISILAVALGVAVLIIVISVFAGFELKLREKILSFTPHLRVVIPGRTMAGYDRVARTIAGNPQVTAVAPFVIGQVLVETKPPSGKPENEAPGIRGLDPRLEDRISALPQSIISGRFDLRDHGVVLGIELARKLKVKVGEPLLVYSPADLLEWHRRATESGQKPPEPVQYVVRGIFDAGYFKFNSSWIAVSLEDAQHLYNLHGSVHGLLVMVKDPSRAETVQRELERALGPNFQISNWIEDNSVSLGQVIEAKKVQFYLLFFIMLAAALCILSALITFVIQKTREVGMLKALGATDLQVASLFLSQTGFIGTIGIALGLALGRLALAYRNEFLHFLRKALHSEVLAPSIYGFGELPAQIVPRDLLLICCSALLICLLGGVIPAWMASRLKPVEALRHETCS